MHVRRTLSSSAELQLRLPRADDRVRPLTQELAQSSDKYAGASPCIASYIIRHSLNWMRCATGSQCSRLLVLKTAVSCWDNNDVRTVLFSIHGTDKYTRQAPFSIRYPIPDPININTNHNPDPNPNHNHNSRMENSLEQIQLSVLWNGKYNLQYISMQESLCFNGHFSRWTWVSWY